MQSYFLTFSGGDVMPCRSLYHAQELQADMGGVITMRRTSRVSMLVAIGAGIVAAVSSSLAILAAMGIFLAL